MQTQAYKIVARYNYLATSEEAEAAERDAERANAQERPSLTAYAKEARAAANKAARAYAETLEQ